MFRAAAPAALALLLAACASPPAPPPADTSAAAPAETNLNLQDFDFVTGKLRANYAGWDTKVTDETRPALDALTARLRAEAADASPEELTTLLQEWTGFFGDGHVGVSPLSAEAPAASDASAAPPAYPALDWTEASVRAELAALGLSRDPLEGIWQIDGDRYRIGVLRTPGKPGTFSAVVLTTTSESWAPGQIKAELTRKDDGALDVLFRSGDHSEHRVAGSLLLNGAAIGVEDWGSWTREVPALPDPGLVERALPSGRLSLKPLSDKTLWLQIPDFDDSRAQPLKDLLAKYAAELASYPNLLIDLRENGGGSDFVYAPLTPLLYTRPIYSIGVEMRATEDNIALRKTIAEEIRAEAPDVAQHLDAQIARMAANIGGFVPGGDELVYIERLDTVLPFPKRVAVLIDGAGSTGEQFLLEARQSRKVTLFGKENSAGVLDFANVVGMPTPSGRYQAYWATSRSMRLPGDPVDPDGIVPDIRIPEDEQDPVGYSQRWLERQVD